jgi:hypothetical protein
MNRQEVNGISVYLVSGYRDASAYTPEEIAIICTEADTLIKALIARGYRPGAVNATPDNIVAYSYEIAPNTWGASLAHESLYHCEAKERTWWTSSGPATCPAWAK